MHKRRVYLISAGRDSTTCPSVLLTGGQLAAVIKNFWIAIWIAISLSFFGKHLLLTKGVLLTGVQLAAVIKNFWIAFVSLPFFWKTFAFN